jgi:hypothetical protein
MLRGSAPPARPPPPPTPLWRYCRLRGCILASLVAAAQALSPAIKAPVRPLASVRATVQHVKTSKSFRDDFHFYSRLVLSDLACDMFLGLRFLVVAQVTLATETFVVLNHGVINVLVIAFAMEIVK